MTIPHHLMSEANIQAELYGACKAAGMNVTLEVTSPAGRLDLAIFSADWNYILAIVECKHNEWKKVFRSRQIERYKQIGVPVFGLAKMDCRSMVSALSKIRGGVHWEKVLMMSKVERRSRKFWP